MSEKEKRIVDINFKFITLFSLKIIIYKVSETLIKLETLLHLENKIKIQTYKGNNLKIQNNI